MNAFMIGFIIHAAYCDLLIKWSQLFHLIDQNLFLQSFKKQTLSKQWGYIKINSVIFYHEIMYKILE